MTGLLAPAARKMDDRIRELTVRLIEERSPGLGNEWLQLTQPAVLRHGCPGHGSCIGGHDELAAMTRHETRRCR